MEKCENCYHAEICKNYPNTGLPPKMRQELIHKGCEYYINTADVQEVVRCKDCVYYNEKTKTCSEFTTYRLPTGGRFAFLIYGNDFCSLGKRKGGDDNG